MQPVVDGLEAEFAQKIALIQVNVSTSEGRKIFASYSLLGHPAYLLLNEDGEILWQGVGEQPELLLREAIAQVLEK